ncbi:MAG: sigma-70 family RNA polymerase sigma factor, partial [Opitutus sp.]
RESFPTTQWSVVVSAGAGSASEANVALESLCRQYWHPLYSFIRWQGRSRQEAEDCTQEFLARLLATEGIARARPERGRFRTFLLGALRNFLIDEWHRARTAKRGGGQVVLPLEFEEGERRFVCEAVDPKLTPEQAFDRNWAVGLIDCAIRELQAEYKKSGRGALFDALRPFIWENIVPDSLPLHAAGLKMNPHALTMALHRLRGRLGERLRVEVANTVSDGADVDEELRYLIAVVGEKRS